MPQDLRELYRPPAVDEPVREAPLATTRGYYVVSRGKFLLLFLLTFGVYSFYWHFEHWRRHRAASQEDISPFWRAVFAIFFTHALFRNIDYGAGKATSEFRWRLQSMATLYVVLVIASQLLVRTSSWMHVASLQLVGVLCGLFRAYPLHAAQCAANVAAGDAEGASNGTITALNYAFLLLGGVVWVLFFIGTFGNG